MNMMVGPVAAATRCLQDDGSLVFTNLMLGANMTLTRVDDELVGGAKPQPGEQGGNQNESGASSLALEWHISWIVCLLLGTFISIRG